MLVAGWLKFIELFTTTNKNMRTDDINTKIQNKEEVSFFDRAPLLKMLLFVIFVCVCFGIVNFFLFS